MSAHELQHVIDALGRTLLHFLWQGAVIALVLEAWLAATKQRPSGERYLARCAGLLLLCAAPAWTFALLWLRGPIGPDPILEAVASSAVAAEVTQTAQELGNLPLLVALWAVGVALFSLRLVGGCAELVRLRRRLVGAPLTPEWQARFDAAAHRFGTRAKALVVDSAVVAVPTVIGYVKPVVLLPARLFTGLTSDQLEALIAHELAHVARHDTLVNLAQSVVESLFFYHPAVWWISRGLRTEREFCCDDRAVVATQDGLSYARALAALEAWRGPQPQLGVSTLGGSLMQRIQRLVGPKPGSTAGASPRHAIATLAALGMLGATAYGFASWTAPAAAHDCECSCHGESAKREPARWRVVTGDDAEGQGVHEVILGTGSGASSGGGGSAPGRLRFGTGGGGGAGRAQPHAEYRRMVLGKALASGGDGEFPGGGEYRFESRSNGGQDVDLAQVERQLAELKVQLQDLAQQRAILEEKRVDSVELHGHGLQELLGKVHESSQGARGGAGGGAWIDARIESKDGEPRTFWKSQGASGGHAFPGGAGGGESLRVPGVTLHESKDAKGSVRYELIAPGGGGGGVRFFTKGIDGETTIDVDVDVDIEELHERLAAPHGRSGAHVLRGGSSGNLFFEDSDGAFEGVSGNVFFGDSDGDGLPDQRLHVSGPHGAHGATGGGGAGGRHEVTRGYLALPGLQGGDVVIEELRGAEAEGELLFDDHGVRVRKLPSGVLMVETGSANGDEVYLELRTTLDEATGELDVEPVIERVEGSRKPAKAKARGRFPDRAPQ